MALSWLTAAHTVDEPSNWELAENENGIRVWTREVPDSQIRELKATSVIEAPVGRIRKVLSDTEAFPEFMPYVEQARILDSGPGWRIVYQLVDPPLVSPRDYTIRVTTSHDENSGQYVRRWTIANHHGPHEQEDVVRVKTNQGRWILEPVSDQRTRVTYYLYTNPGGSIPGWVANQANSNSVPKLLRAVANRARDPDWTG